MFKVRHYIYQSLAFTDISLLQTKCNTWQV